MALISLASVVAVGAGAGIAPLLGLSALAAVVMGLIVLARPAVAAFVLVAAVPIVSGLRRGLPVPGVRLSEVLIVGLSLGVLLCADRRDAVPWRALDWAILAYAVGTAGLGTIALLGRGEPFSAGNVGELLGPFQFVLLYRAIVTALNSTSDCQKALRLVLLASIPVAILTTLQHFRLAGAPAFLADLTGFDYAADPGRATGPFPHWHELGGYMFLVILLAVALWLSGSERVLSRPLIISVAALAGIAAVQTATIAPILGTLVGCTALALWYRRLGRVAVWACALGILGVLVFGSLFTARLSQQYNPPAGQGHHGIVPFTLAYRYDVWSQQYIPAVAKHLLTGYGPGTPPEVTWAFTESSYVTMLVRGGLLLLLIFLALLAALLVAAMKRASTDDADQRGLARMLVVTAAALFPLQMVAPYLVNVGVPHLLWGLAGVLVAWQRSESLR